MLVPLLLALALPAVSSSQGEGFVNQYASEGEYSDGKTFRFVSESIENIGAGWRARETYRIVDENVFIETFELAAPGKEFEVYTESRFKRKR